MKPLLKPLLKRGFFLVMSFPQVVWCGPQELPFVWCLSHSRVLPMSTQRQETEGWFPWWKHCQTLSWYQWYLVKAISGLVQSQLPRMWVTVCYSSILVVRWYCIKLQLHRCESLCPSQACEFWQKSLQLIQRLLKAKTREVKQKRLKHSTELKENSLHMRYFWSAQQQFFRQLLKLGSEGLGRAWRGLATVVGRKGPISGNFMNGSGSAPKLTQPYPWRPRHNSGGVILEECHESFLPTEPENDFVSIHKHTKTIPRLY